MSWMARPDETPAIAGLLRQLGYEATDEQAERRIAQLDPDTHVVVVQRVDGEVIGFGAARLDHTLQRDEPVGRILALAVDTDHQGRGAGTQLVRRLEGWARDRGARTMTVNSGDHRRDAHRFYRRRGYEHTGARFGRTL